MSGTIRWDTMSEDQRNEFVAERVMGRTPMCSGALEIKKRVVPDRKGGIAFVFYTWKCPVCGLDKGGSPPPTENEHKNGASIPRYTTSMDAAWLVIERLAERELFVNFEMHYLKKDRRYDFDRISVNFCFRNTVNTDRQPYRHSSAEPENLGSMAEAICLAALRACGVEVLTEPRS